MISYVFHLAVACDSQVKTLTGKTILFDFRADETIESLKERIQDREAWPEFA